MRKLVAVCLMAGMLAVGCETMDNVMTPNTKKGAAIGAVAGGIAGAIIGSGNPWKGAVIGAAGGALLGGIIGNVVDRAANTSAQKDSDVKYTRTTEDGTSEDVVAEYKGVEGNYELVNMKYYRNGQLVREELKKVPIQ